MTTDEKTEPGVFVLPDGSIWTFTTDPHTLGQSKYVRRLVKEIDDGDDATVSQAQLVAWTTSVKGAAFKGLRVPRTTKDGRPSLDDGLAFARALEGWDEAILAQAQRVAILATVTDREGEQAPGFPGDAGSAEGMDKPEHVAGAGAAREPDRVA